MNEHASERCVFFFFLKRSKLFVQRCISIVDPRLKFDVRKLSQNEESQPSFSRSIFHPLVRYDRSVFSEIVVNTYLPLPPPSSPINLISFLGCGVFIFPMRTGCCTQKRVIGLPLKPGFHPGGVRDGGGGRNRFSFYQRQRWLRVARTTRREFTIRLKGNRYLLRESSGFNDDTSLLCSWPIFYESGENFLPIFVQKCSLVYDNCRSTARQIRDKFVSSFFFSR